MTNQVQELIARKDKISKDLRNWQNKAAVAQADEERLKAEIAQSMKKLKDSFGCTSYAAATEKLEEMLKEASDLADDLEGKLNAIRS